MAQPVRGFTLIEVLISILVLAIGMFSAAALQLSALRTTQQSSMHTTALGLAAELSDKMRMNTGAMSQTDADNLFLKIDFNATVTLDEPAKFCNLDVECNAEELAKFDIYEWKKRIKDQLSTGRAKVCRDANAWDGTATRYTWTCSESGSSNPVTVKIGWQGKNVNGVLERSADGTFPPQVALVVAPYAQ